MRVIFCERRTISNFHIHAGSYAEMFYVPDYDCAFGREQLGSFGSMEDFISEAEHIVNEGKDLSNGIIPNTENISFDNVKELDLTYDNVINLIDRLKDVQTLQEYNKIEIENLIKENK